jgi:hypothetical protein
MDKKLVLELKFHPDNYYLASQIVKDIPFRLSRNSKYVNGVCAISGQ